MNFNTSFPITSNLLSILGKEAQLLAAGGVSWLQKGENSIAVVVQLAPIFNELGALKTELVAIGTDTSGAAQLAAVEALVSDLAFSSPKAQAIVQAVFAFGNEIVALVSPTEAAVKAVEALVAAVK